MNDSIQTYLQQLHLPRPDSHKGQNGKLLIIGGSNLFHAASKWSLDVASKFVDMVFYSSVPSNNELIQAAKKEFWNGIVVERGEVENYLSEADCILIGPGMERNEETEELTNRLLKKYPQKKWVIDAGALQMVNPTLLNDRCIITPHLEEFKRVYRKVVAAYTVQLEDGSYRAHFKGETCEWDGKKTKDDSVWFEDSIIPCIEKYEVVGQPGYISREDFQGYLSHFSKMLNGATVLIKSQKDFVFQFNHSYLSDKLEVIEGGNAGMTKGGTGDVLAGLVAGLFCQNEIFTAAVVASYINKKAGDALYEKVGPNFNASDLVQQIPQTLWDEVKSTTFSAAEPVFSAAH